MKLRFCFIASNVIYISYVITQIDSKDVHLDLT